MFNEDIILNEKFDFEKYKQLKKEYKIYKKIEIKNGRTPISFKKFCQKRGLIIDAATTASGIAGGAIGVAAATKGKEMISGVKRVYHATQNRKDNPHVIDSIEENGLKANYGGTAHSKTDSENAEKEFGGALKDAKKNNKGKVQFGRLDHVIGYVTNPKYTKGSKLKDRKVLAIDLPYDDYKQAKTDSNMSGVLQKNLKMKKKTADAIIDIGTGAKMLDKDIDKRAIINNSKVSTKEKIDYKKENFNQYSKKHKGRIAKGVALTTAGSITGIAAGVAAKKVIENRIMRRKAYEKYKNKGGKLSYKDFCIKIYKEYIS